MWHQKKDKGTLGGASDAIHAQDDETVSLLKAAELKELLEVPQLTIVWVREWIFPSGCLSWSMFYQDLSYELRRTLITPSEL